MTTFKHTTGICDTKGRHLVSSIGDYDTGSVTKIKKHSREEREDGSLRRVSEMVEIPRKGIAVEVLCRPGVWRVDHSHVQEGEVSCEDCMAALEALVVAAASVTAESELAGKPTGRTTLLVMPTPDVPIVRGAGLNTTREKVASISDQFWDALVPDDEQPGVLRRLIERVKQIAA